MIAIILNIKNNIVMNKEQFTAAIEMAHSLRDLERSGKLSMQAVIE